MSKELTDAKRKAIAKYDASNTRQFHLKLNKNTNAKIIQHLDRQPNIQGYIKDCIIVAERFRSCNDCNNCSNRNSCEYLPGPGEITRINCPLWK